MELNLPKHKKLILFDGVCNLCNSSVQFIIKHDKNNVFLFTPLQSDIGKHLIDTYHIDTNKTDSVLLFSPEKGISYKSTAALRIARQLRFPINLMTVFMIIPTPIRDWAYDYIARNRYKWYGKKEHCMIPTPELKSKFLGNN
jgi:predicted DCC family thiol-disulfide oxidoreductase YuxK